MAGHGSFDGRVLHRSIAKVEGVTVTAKTSSAPVATVPGHLPTVAKPGTVDAMRIPSLDSATGAALTGDLPLPK